MTRNRWMIVILILLGGLAAVVLFRSPLLGRAQADTDWQTVMAKRGSLTSTVGATGTVRSRQHAALGFGTSGTVENVLVEVGDQVTKGEMLADLKDTSLNAQVVLAQADLVSAQRSLEELLRSSQQAAQAQLALAQARDELDAAEYRRRVQQAGFRASSDTIAAAEANLVLAENEVDRAEEAYNQLSGRPEDDPARALALSNLVAARKHRDAVLRELNWYTGHPSPLDQALLDANVALAEAKVADAEREWERLRDGPDPDDIAAAEARIAAAQATLETALITAPFDGTVVEVKVMPGDQTGPGSVAIQLSDLSALYVEVQVSEVDINGIQKGNPVTLELDAVQDRIYHGEVVEIGLTGEILQGIVNFPVTVEVLDPDSGIKPGMTAAVNIIVEQIQDVLLVPNRAVRVRDGQRVVYLLEEGTPKQVKIRLGASSDIESQVLEGELSAGDLIILNPPSVFEGNGPFFGGP